MTNMTTVKARNKFSELLNRAAYGKERIILTRRGRNLVAVIPVEDLELLEEIENIIDLEDAQKALKEAKKNQSVPWSKLKKNLGL